MNKIKLGIIREGKVPPDKRVPLTPSECKLVEAKFPNVKLFVQASNVRAFPDREYTDAGIPVVEDLSDCDIIMGVKEINIEDLIPNKKYLFFSHTIKKQPYNRELLRAILDRKIQLIDYEVLKDKHNKRIIGFGRYAGIVGCYNAFLTYGLKNNLYTLKPAHECHDRKEMEEELHKVLLPSGTKIVLTGFGRVGHGAREVIDLLPITEVSPEEFLADSFEGAVFTHLDTEDYYAPKNGGEFVKSEFYANPSGYKSVFSRYANTADMYVACHFWSNKSPVILSAEDLQNPKRKLTVIADISCDVKGPIASTIRPSKIGDSIYGYDPDTEKETDFRDPDAIAVMAVDNLPCELPRDASQDFGTELIRQVFPALFGDDPDKIIERASETDLHGRLMPLFEYLSDYVAGETVKS